MFWTAWPLAVGAVRAAITEPGERPADDTGDQADQERPVGGRQMPCTRGFAEPDVSGMVGALDAVPCASSSDARVQAHPELGLVAASGDGRPVSTLAVCAGALAQVVATGGPDRVASAWPARAGAPT